jgi:hypothetical protein
MRLGDKELLEKIGKSFVSDLKKNQKERGLFASGFSANSLRIEQNEFSLKVFGAGYFEFQEYGRGPTKNFASNSPTLKERIRVWIDQKPLNPIDISKDSLAFIISRKIHKEGTLLFKNRAEKIGLEEIVKTHRERFRKQLIKRKRVDFSSEIIRSLKK